MKNLKVRIKNAKCEKILKTLLTFSNFGIKLAGMVFNDFSEVSSINDGNKALQMVCDA